MYRKRWCMVVLALVAGCASAPRHRYAVNRFDVEGMKQMDERALTACLATRERDKVKMGIGSNRNLECDEPPFDNSRASVRVFAWPWSEWPSYDEAVLKLDLERVERWYEARGFYDAKVTGTKLEPEAAEDSDRVDCDAPPCKVDIRLAVAEGEPVLVRHVALTYEGTLPEPLKAELFEALDIDEGDRFDEAYYERAKENVWNALREAGYARAQVAGDVAIHRGLLWADLTIKVTPGVICKIGDVRIDTNLAVPYGPVRAAAKLRRGQLYRKSDLDDAQAAIFALGAFAAVTVRGDLEGSSEWVDIDIDLEPRRESEWLLGVGVMSGLLTTGPAASEWVSVPQWDAHLLGRYEHRNFFGGLRHFTIEERPRLLFLDAFPGVPDNSPRFGNVLEAAFSQPGVFEPRTKLFLEARWDHGPDPFLLFFRHDFGVSLGLERAFFQQRLHVRGAIHQDIMEVSPRQPILNDRELAQNLPLYSDEYALNEIPSSYRLPFLGQRVVLDLRDDRVRPTLGAYFASSFHESVRVWDPSWTYIRITPEARGYVPVGLGMVLAARFAIGMLHIFDASDRLDVSSQTRGPLLYRLHGGGAQSNRGFAPGTLGVGLLGGIRRWESSLELRVPLNSNFSVAFFGDMGDVNDRARFRFDHLNTAVGGGLRYRTIIGPIRLDVGYRPRPLQLASASERQTNLGFARFDGAVHLTIGESF